MLKKRFRKFVLFLIVAVMLMLPKACAFSIGVDVKDKTLSFLRDVLDLDLSKYMIKLSDYFVEYPDEVIKNLREDVTYSLEGANSQIRASCLFINKSMIYCRMYAEQGAPTYVRAQGNIINRVRNILERYRDWSGDGSLNEMLEMLTLVEPRKNMTVVVGTWRFTFKTTPEFTDFSWLYVLNGVTYPNCLGVSFVGNNVYFLDERKLYTIGSADVKTSKDDAVAIALKYVENYSFEIFMGDQPSIVVDDFGVVKEKITAELLSWPREEYTLYPYWKVDLPLDKLYPGNIYEICVNIWADTGEVFRCVPLGFGGSLPTQDSQPEQTTNSQENTLEWTSTPVVVFLIVFAIATSALIIHKWKKPLSHHLKQRHNPPSQPVSD